MQIVYLVWQAVFMWKFCKISFVSVSKVPLLEFLIKARVFFYFSSTVQAFTFSMYSRIKFFVKNVIIILFFRNTKNLQKKFEISTLEKMCKYLMKHWLSTMICYQTFSWYMELISQLKLMPKTLMEKAIIIGMFNLILFYLTETKCISIHISSFNPNRFSVDAKLNAFKTMFKTESMSGASHGDEICYMFR